MANQRPIRRGKIPFFRRKKRPTRWLGYSQAAVGNDGEVDSLLVPLASTSTLNPPILVVIDGGADVAPWADETEVTLDRVVGSILTQFVRVLDPGTPNLVEEMHQAFCRYGLLVAEETEEGAPPPAVNLFDSDVVEAYEWMWIQDVVPEESSTSIVMGDDSVVTTNLTRTPLDVRVRRKIGPKDQLLLYGALARMELGFTTNSFFFARALPNLREIVMSR